MKLDRSQSWGSVTGLEPTGGVSNYFVGNDKAAWRSNIPNYARISAANVYDGIDLVFYSNGSDLEYDFVVKPGADPKSIRMAFEGQAFSRVDQKSGDLILTTAGGSELRQVHPKVYQQLGNRRVEVAGGYQLLEGGRATFALASYDRRRALIIDPTLAFARAYGGSNEDWGGPIAVDSDGNAYLTGSTASTDFPLVNALHRDQQYTDAFVMKLAPNGNILYSSYFGGNGLDTGYGIAVDSTGVYVAGATTSTNFRYVTEPRTTWDTFVIKLSLTGWPLYTAVVGGSAEDIPGAIAINPNTHFAYVTGHTSSTDFPRINDHNYWHQSQFNGIYDAFIFELDASGNLFRSELMGGHNQEWGESIAVDHVGGIWVSGFTCSSDFPLLLNSRPFPTTGCTGFVALWDSNFYFLRFSKLWSAGLAMAVDAVNNGYVVGGACAPDLTTPGAFQTSLAPGVEAALISKFAYNGTVLASTCLGSNGSSFATGVALSSAGEVYVSGATTSTAFPGAPSFQPNPITGFFSRLSPDLTTLRYSRLVTSNNNNQIALLDTSPAAPRQIYVAGIAGHNWYTGDASQTAVLVTKFTEDLDPVSGLLRLRNFWKPDQCINIESGAVASGPIQPGWLSAQWVLVSRPPTNGDPAGQNVFWIQNRWKPDQYLNIESGAIQSTPIQPGWLSARWTFEPVSGTNLYRIRNVWQLTQYRNIESGVLTAGPVVTDSPIFPPGWWSALWMPEPVN